MSARTVRRALGVIVVLGIIAAIAVPTVNRIERALSLPLRYESVIRQQARAKHLDPALIAAVIYAETKFVARTSPTGALGLMQIEPATAQFLAGRSGGVDFRIADLAKPSVNIAYGAYYLRYLLDEFGHDETVALAAYNGGETNVERWLAEAHSANATFTLASIPYPETRAYVQRVERAQREYRKKYGL